jgi:hypothetical protein
VTLSDLLARGRTLVRSWWAVPALALVVCLLLVSAWNGQRRARGAAERAAEAAELRAAGLAVAADLTARQLRARVAELEAGSADLKAELERVRHASPGARPVGTVSATTGPVPAGGPTRPPWPCAPVAPCPVTPDAPPVDPGPPPALQACLLAAGDTGEVRVLGAALATRAGNLVVVGAAEAWRLDPGPPARLFGGPLQVKVSREAPVGTPGWGVGVVALAGRSGWAAGPAISPPPLSFWGLQLEALAGAGVGPGGEWAATGIGLVRW